MIRLWIENEQEKEEIPEEVKKAMEKAIEHTLQTENFGLDAEISLTITDDNEIHRLNLQERGIDRPTDVLSFPMLEYDNERNMIDFDYDMDEGFIMLGDIVISAERAAAQATEYGHGFLREMAFLTVNSMLHLLGYDHENSEAEEKLMFEKQEQILNDLGITR